LEHSVADNISLSVFDRISTRGWISQQKWSDLATEKIKSLKVKTASAAAAVRTLSGGNQQKVVLAKWLASDPRIVIFDEPTAGIDIGSKSEIIQLIRELAREGKAIIVISSELNELLAACDRILVMSDGRLLRDMSRDEFEDPTAGKHTAAGNMQFAERKLQTTLQEVRNHG
jgi:ribose transport system ATP-binding protein